jgi:aminopeptidase N
MRLLLPNLLLAIGVLLLPLAGWADGYPVNKNIDIQHYAFTITLSDSTDEIFGKAQITVLFKKAGIQQLRFDLVNKTAEKMGRGMVIDAIIVGNQPLQYTHGQDEVLVQLLTPSVENSTITYTIVYHGIPFSGLRIGNNKFGERTFFTDNWPNKARQWLPVVDHPSDKATSEFIVTAPAHFKVISNGLLLEESAMGNQTRLTHWKQSVPVSPWLFVLGVADFAVQYTGHFRGKSLETWVYAKNREEGFGDFATPSRETLEFFSNYIGPFAYEKLANIQTASVSGGMEASSAIFYAENLVDGKKSERTRNVIIHEIAHQWFGNAVTESSWDDVWLSEGFATYFTMLFIEHAYGRPAFDKEIMKAKKTVFDLAARMPAFSIISPRSPEQEEVTSGITYQKGAWVLHMLRNELGEVAFKKGIQQYYARFYNANATTNDFRKEMEKVSGKNLQIFFKQWLYQPVSPLLEAGWFYNAAAKKLILRLTQQQAGQLFSLPVEIGYYTKGNPSPVIVKINLSSQQQTQSFSCRPAPDSVVIDPRNVLLCQSRLSALSAPK